MDLLESHSPIVQKPSDTRAGVRPRPVPSGKRLPMAGKVQKIDLVSQAFARDPFPTYASLREAGPVFQTRLPLLGKTWVATTYQAASEVLKDDETFVMEAKKVGKTLFSGILRLLPRTLRVVSDTHAHARQPGPPPPAPPGRTGLQPAQRREPARPHRRPL